MFKNLFFQFTGRAGKKPAFQRVCSWCNRIEHKGRWLVRRPKPHRPITHGICPDCYEAALADIEQRAPRSTPRKG